MENNNMVKVNKLGIYGIGDENKNYGKFSFDGSIATGIENIGKEYRELHKGSITLGDQAALLQWYLASELGEAPEMPKEARDVIYRLFGRDDRYDNITDDACDYDGGKVLKKVKDTDMSVRWIVRPEGFELGENEWIAKLGENSEVHYINIPKSGYIELTDDGSYRPDTGTPFSTVETIKEAEESWTKRGFDPEFARDVVSQFSSREEGAGTASVIREYYSSGNNLFDVVAAIVPDWKDWTTGSLPVIRSAGRSG